MTLLLLGLSGPPALAQDMINGIGEELTVDVGGGWARAFPEDGGGWDMTFSAGGNYVLTQLEADLSWVDQSRRDLTTRTNLVDHAITRCADGTWLHVASATLDDPDDTAYVFHYDANFNTLASGVVEERVYERKHNDPLVACTAEHKVVGFTTRQIRGGEIFILNDDMTVASHKPLDGAPTVSGTSMLRDADNGGLILAGFQLGSNDTDLLINHYDANLDLVSSLRLDVTPQGQRCYWSQGFMRVNGFYLIANICRDDNAGWSADTGDVWLQVLDADFTLLEQHQVTHNTLPDGGMRPYLTRRDDTVVMSYDRSIRPRMHVIRLNRGEFGLGEPGDTQLGSDTGSGPLGDDTSGGVKGVPPERACGCAGASPAGRGGAVGGLLALGLLAVRRRR